MQLCFSSSVNEEYHQHAILDQARNFEVPFLNLLQTISPKLCVFGLLEQSDLESVTRYYLLPQLALPLIFFLLLRNSYFENLKQKVKKSKAFFVLFCFVLFLHLKNLNWRVWFAASEHNFVHPWSFIKNNS